MTIHAIGKTLATELHRRLKPLGFSKRGSTFSRGRTGYTELFRITGSAWNSGEEPWVFYLDVAVRLDDIPTDARAKGLWREAHAVGRVNHLLASAPGDFAATANSVGATAEQLAHIVCQASDALPNALTEIERRASKGLLSPLPIPASWAQ